MAFTNNDYNDIDIKKVIIETLNIVSIPLELV